MCVLGLAEPFSWYAIYIFQLILRKSLKMIKNSLFCQFLLAFGVICSYSYSQPQLNRTIKVVLYLFFLIMRWMILTTKHLIVTSENYIMCATNILLTLCCMWNILFKSSFSDVILWDVVFCKLFQHCQWDQCWWA